jgi:hypothetical protein
MKGNIVSRKVVNGEYGTCVVEQGNRPEPSREEREAAVRADRILFGPLAKQMTCELDEFIEITNRQGFPRPLGYQYVGRIAARREAVYSIAAINEWLRAQRALVAAFPAAVK